MGGLGSIHRATPTAARSVGDPLRLGGAKESTGPWEGKGIQSPDYFYLPADLHLQHPVL
jgi:hypothetical protein